MSENNIKELSIQISLSGFSFCILNATTNTVELLMNKRFDQKTTPNNLLKRLKVVLDTNTQFSQSFNSVLIIYKNELYNLVPKSLFNKDNSADYLKFNAKILKTDFISHDEIAINNSVNVYIPLVNINNYIFDNFGTFTYKHYATVLIENILKKEENSTHTKLYVTLDSYQSFDIIAANNGQLLLLNTFEYTTKEDFIYYILFVVEQLQLDPEIIHLEFIGNIKEDDDLFQIAYKYIRFVTIYKPDYNYKFNATQQLQNDYSHFVLLNSFMQEYI